MINKKPEEFQKLWAKIIAKAWADPAFKQKLLKNPVQTLKENGIEIPSSVHVKIDENSDKVFHLVLPMKPDGRISEEEIAKVAGGACRIPGC